MPQFCFQTFYNYILETPPRCYNNNDDDDDDDDDDDEEKERTVRKQERNIKLGESGDMRIVYLFFA